MSTRMTRRVAQPSPTRLRTGDRARLAGPLAFMAALAMLLISIPALSDAPGNASAAPMPMPTPSPIPTLAP